LNYIHKQCDKYYSAIVILLANEHCELCSEPNNIFKPLAAHHSIFRSQDPSCKVRYDWNLGICLCPKCHELAHSNYTIFMDEIQKSISPEKWEYIQLKLNTKWEKSFSDPKKWRNKLKKKHKELSKTAWMNKEMDIAPNNRWRPS